MHSASFMERKSFDSSEEHFSQTHDRKAVAEAHASTDAELLAECPEAREPLQLVHERGRDNRGEASSR